MKRNDSTKFRIVISKREERRKDSLTDIQEVSPSSVLLLKLVGGYMCVHYVTLCNFFMSEIFQNKCFKNKKM